MNDNRLGGSALIFGALSGIITMILHPVAGGAHRLTPAQFETLTALMIGVHALAIVGIPFLFLGALTLTRRLDSPGRLAFLALAIYGVSLVAVMIAPAMSGLVGTEILREIVAAGAGGEPWRLLMDYNHMINQAFTRIYVVASCVAIALWSVMVVKRRALSRWIGFYGLLYAAVALGALFSGLKMDVHGFGLIIFGGAFWLISVGVLLLRAKPLSLTGSDA